MTEPNKDPSKQGAMTIFLGIGFELVGFVIAFFFVGKYIDPYLGGNQLGIGLSILVGFALWFVHVIFLLKKLNSK